MTLLQTEQLTRMAFLHVEHNIKFTLSYTSIYAFNKAFTCPHFRYSVVLRLCFSMFINWYH